MAPFVESNDIRDDGNALRRRADCDGYLFLRDFADKAAILEARRDMAAILAGVGWIDAGTDPSEAITSHPAVLAGTPDFTPVYDTIQCLESFHSLAHDAAILDLLAEILGPDVLLQPSNIARVIFPSGLEHTTPAHQDFVHIQGTPDVWTAWLPLGDCPESLGGLSVLTPHQGRLSWEEVYKGWKSDRYQYHWQRFALQPVPKEAVEIVEETRHTS